MRAELENRCSGTYGRRPRSRSLALCCLLTLALALGAVPMAQALSLSAGPNFGTYSIGEVQVPLSATGISGEYAWEIIGGALPPGIALRTDLESWFPSSASAGLIGVATTPGIYEFTLRVTSGPETAVAPCTIRIAGLAVSDVSSLPDAFAGAPYSYALTAVGAAGSLTWTATGVPPGMTLSPAGVLSGTPLTPGGYNMNVNVNDGVDSVWRSIRLNVYAIQITTPGELPNALRYDSYSATLTATGGSGSYTFTATANDLPSGLVLDPSGLLWGTVTAGPGTFFFTLTATDTNRVSYSKRMTIDVISSPSLLPRVSPWLYTWPGNLFVDCTIGVVCNATASVSSGGTAPFTWSATGLPPGLSIRSGSGITSSGVHPGQAQIWGVSTETGTYDVELTVTDADGASATNTFPLRVSALLMRPSLPSGTIYTPYSGKLRVIGGTPPYTVAHVGGRLPKGLAFDALNFRLTGTPLENCEAGNSCFNPIFEFTDSEAGPNTLRAINYLAISDGSSTLAIRTGSPLGTVAVGSSYSRQLTACCVPSYSWSVATGPLPPGLSLSAGGLLSGTPTMVGTYTFLLQAADAENLSNRGVRQFTMIVTPLAVTTSSTLPFGLVGSPYTAALAVSGATGAPTWALDPWNYLPPGLTLDPSGALVGTPAASGQYSFSATVTDGAGYIFARTFTIFIYPEGGYPPLDLPIGPSLGGFELGAVRVRLPATGGVPPYHYSLSPGATVVAGMRVQDGPPLPTSFPSSVTGGYLGVLTQPGTYSTSLRVTDSVGNTFDRAVSVTALSPLVLSQTSLPKATLGVPYSFRLTINGDVGAFSWSATTLPPGMAVDSSGQIYGIPTAAGTFNSSVKLTYLSGAGSLTVSLTLVVDPFAIGPDGVLSEGTIGVPYSQAFAADCGGGCAWSVSGSLPSGLSLSSAGVLSGTPTGTFNSAFTVQAIGPSGTVQKRFSLQVLGNYVQPLFITTTSPLGDTTVGSRVGYRLSAQGGTPPYEWQLQDGLLPLGVTLEGHGEALAAAFDPGFSYLLGRPLEVGVFSFTLAVTDAVGTRVTRAFTWRVAPIALDYTSLPISTGGALRYGTSYTQALLAMGGTGRYTWSAIGMPPGLTLDPTTGVVSGSPLNTGSFSVPVEVADDAGDAFKTYVNFTVSGTTPTTLTFGAGPSLGSVQQGYSLSRSLSPSGGTPPYTLTALTPLPPGCALLSGEALLSGSSAYVISCVPMAAGTFGFTVQATDSAGNTGVRTFTLAVTPFTLFTGTSLADGSVGRPYSEPLLTWTGGSPVVWSVMPGSALPPGLGISTDGVISGVPAQAGTYSFTLGATDASALGMTYTFSLRISKLAITDPAILPAHTYYGVPYSYTFSATGGAGPLVWSATGLPSGLTMSPTGTMSGTVRSGGLSSLIVTVTDGVVPVSRRFGLVRRWPNEPLSPSSRDLGYALVGQSFSAGTNTPVGGVPPWTWRVAEGSELPPGVRLLSGATLPSNQTPGSGLLAGVPTTPGAYTFDLMVRDTVGTEVPWTYTLKVTAFGILPGSPRSAVVGTPYAQRFTAVGGVPPYTFSVSPSSISPILLPAGLSFSPDGLISGTPTSTGSYSFFVQVEDASASTFRQSYSVTVNNAFGLRVNTGNPNNPPIGADRTTTLQTSGTSTYTWSLVDGAMPPGFSLIAGAGSPSVNVMAGRPMARGTYTYTLRATDNANPANFADRLFVFPVSELQVVSPPFGFLLRNDLPAGTVGLPYSAAVKVAGGTPPYAFSLSPLYPLPPGLELSANGILSGVPERAGSYSIVPMIVDAVGRPCRYYSAALVITPVGAPVPLGPGSTSALVDASVGVPYALPLSSEATEMNLAAGGVSPYSWSLTAGALPPGIAILPGESGVPDHLVGIPTEAGSYSFTLEVADSGGQTLAVPLTLKVSALALVPDAVPAGRVGTAYSVSFTASGGTGPHTISEWAGGDMPPGLALSPSGVLSGTPTHAGNFPVRVAATDSTGSTLGKVYRITIDNAAGEAPALSLAPRPIHVYHQQGSDDPAPVPVSVGTTSGSLAFDLAVLGIPGATLSATSGTTSAVVNLSFDVSSLAPGTYVGVVGARAPQSANRLDSVPVTLVIAPPPPCTYSVSPAEGSMPAGGGSGSFVLSTGSTCAWSAAVSDPAWITLSSAGSGTGAAIISYGVTSNGGVAERTGSVSVGGQVYTITQFGSACSFAISPASVSATALGGPATISVAASDASCAWTATGLGATPSLGAGSQPVTVIIPANTTALVQIHTATIAGKTLTVTQAGTGCTVGLSPHEASFPAAGGEGSVAVTTPPGCTYDTVVGPTWVSVTSGGSGTGSGSEPGTLVYTVEPNSTTVARSGGLTIGGQTFEITQEALPCGVTLDTSGLGSPYGPAGGIGTIGITTNGDNCSWTASSADPWASVGPSSGTGSAVLGLSVTSNAGSVSARSTDLTIGNQTVALSQGGTTCAFSLQSSTGTVPASGGSGSVGVVAPQVCAWSATSQQPAWLTASSGGTGTSNVHFVAQANASAVPRTGTLRIANLTYTVTQAGAPCSYTLETASPVVVSSGGVSDSFAFETTASGCTPVALSHTGWIGVSTSFDGVSGTVTYTVAANPASTTRTGMVQVGDVLFTLNQTGAPCGFSLNAYGAVFGRAGGSDDVLGSPSGLGCVPVVGTDQPSIIVLDPLAGPINNIFTLPYSVTPFESLTVAVRRARITFGGQIFIVKQTSW